MNTRGIQGTSKHSSKNNRKKKNMDLQNLLLYLSQILNEPKGGSSAI